MPAVKTVKKDASLYSADAVELAREMACDIAEPGTVGEHLGGVTEEERLVTHSFECTAKAYRGWRWSVTVARAPRSKKVTVCEVGLLPGEDAVLSREWVPYADRLQPSDLKPGDVLPYRDQDPLLESGFEATGEEDVDQVALWEWGLGRSRVLSAEGREAAATRWYEGENGPNGAVAAAAKADCASCGFFLPLAGALRRMFGVCASPWSLADGQVVSVDHGCGAHSETDVMQHSIVSVPSPVLDDLAVDAV